MWCIKYHSNFLILLSQTSKYNYTHPTFTYINDVSCDTIACEFYVWFHSLVCPNSCCDIQMINLADEFAHLPLSMLYHAILTKSADLDREYWGFNAAVQSLGSSLAIKSMGRERLIISLHNILHNTVFLV
jgi:hypothetical protein